MSKKAATFPKVHWRGYWAQCPSLKAHAKAEKLVKPFSIHDSKKGLAIYAIRRISGKVISGGAIQGDLTGIHTLLAGVDELEKIDCPDCLAFAFGFMLHKGLFGPDLLHDTLVKAVSDFNAFEAKRK